MLIRYCLVTAAENAVKNSEDWLKVISELDADDLTDISIVRFIVQEKGATDFSSNDFARAEIEKRIAKMNCFLNITKSLSLSLQARLEEL